MGRALKINDDIEFFEDIPTGSWLGCSSNGAKSQKLINNTGDVR